MSSRARQRSRFEYLPIVWSRLSTISRGSGTCKAWSTEDVTAHYLDLQARHTNLLALRERIRELLGRATEMKDLLVAEAELARVQAEIDTLEGSLKRLDIQVDRSTIELTLQRKHVLGPLGLMFSGLYRVVKLLFVLG